MFIRFQSNNSRRSDAIISSAMQNVLYNVMDNCRIMKKITNMFRNSVLSKNYAQFISMVKPEWD